ncbi:hypothetical protein JYK00_06090 [Thermosipho ferrireducens]|uniref:Uncharacterized protein n=1 Tax=Thermosipho ferrireducens TaxID=2571116 RepID=A0ABX7S4E9_9BACT|nr:hypothetical protein [Thermosipho ferrireducens]QTA37309.1 hypothetical protein JYK00_06090 [Thermosipho ferrireducens]
MRVLLGNPWLIEEFDPDIVVTTSPDIGDISYALVYDNEKVIFYRNNSVKDIIKNDDVGQINVENIFINILVGNAVGIAENYLEKADFFICFDKTAYMSKYLFRKAQIIVGSNLSKKSILGVLVYKNGVNYIQAEKDKGITVDTKSYIIFERFLGHRSGIR